MFEGQSHGGLSPIHRVVADEAGAGHGKRVVGVVLCVAVGLQLFCMYK